MKDAKKGRHARAGFTLIELLVVISIIALLIGILLPGLGQARKTAQMVKEQAGAKQFMVAYLTYATEYKDVYIPGSGRWDWSHPQTPAIRESLMPADPGDDNRRMEGNCIKPWPWRLMSVGGMYPQALQIDKNVYADFFGRSHMRTGENAAVGTNLYDAGDRYQAAMAVHPSWGINTVYVGGDYNFGAFQSRSGGNSRRLGGMFWVSRSDQVVLASKLMVITSSRGGDVRSGGAYYNYGQGYPTGQPVVPGYFMVRPPRAHPANFARNFSPLEPGGNYTLTTGWTSTNVTDNRFAANRPVETWGMIHPRHFEKAVSGMTDGHIEMTTLEQLRDMRYWSNYATTADWNFEPR